ncbi:MAG: hypothetical protein K1X83_12550 [Oligoflexia bacterium]|nr:hypothetical protein [Oligoflexia bacterium]
MSNLRISVLVLAIFAFVSVSIQAETLTLKKNQIYRVSASLSCGYIRKRWVPVKKSGDSYEVKKGATSSQKDACKALLKPSKSMSLTEFPDSAAILKAAEHVTSVRPSAVSGTPPTLPEIIEGGGTTLFWRPGVVDAIGSGTPSEGQCGEFFNSPIDGESGGYGACYLAEGVGYSISNIASSGSSLCYMRNFPQAASENEGVVSIVSGAFPNGDVTKIFSAPAGAVPRTIKVNVTGFGPEANAGGPSTIFFKIYSAEQNATQGNQYKFDLWFCEDGETGRAKEFEQIKVTAGGEYVSSSTKNGGGQLFSSTVRGFLTRTDGVLEFDTARGRTAAYGGMHEAEEGTFKSLVSINADNEIRYKVRDQHGSDGRKGYSISRFQGSGLSDLRFLEGAFKEDHEGQFSFEGGTEYRDTFYASAPDGNYAAEVAAIDFDSDAFYSSDQEIPTTPSAFRCNAAVDLEINLNMAGEAMQAIIGNCESGRIDGEVSFCASEELEAAQQRWTDVCAP